MSKEDSPATGSRLAASVLTDCEGSAILQRAVPGGRLTAGCPSGQRERSVKPSAQPTLVRTQHLPPAARTPPDQRRSALVLILPSPVVSGWNRRPAAGCGKYAAKSPART